VLLTGGPVEVRASIGVACSRADDDASELVRRADQAMYLSKRTGRNRVTVFDPG
jgi:diguanylate cyclase (GGDEF)-like protein